MRFNEFFAQKGIRIVCRKENVEPQKPGGFEFHLPDYIRAIKKEGMDILKLQSTGTKDWPAMNETGCSMGVTYMILLRLNL